MTGKYLMKCLWDRSEKLGIKALSHTIVGGLLNQRARSPAPGHVNYRTGEDKRHSLQGRDHWPPAAGSPCIRSATMSAR